MAEFTKRRWMAFCRVVMVILCVAASPLSQGYEGSAFEAIRTLSLQGPYAQLPHYEVTGTLFGPSGDRPENRLRAAAIRTLSNNADVFDFPAGQKLFQPNGICFKGRWEIDQGSPYDGYFSNPSRGLLIVRASVTLSETQRGARRAFALAGKLFPTLDRTAVVHTANFFSIENVLGSNDEHFLDAVLDNHPVISGLPSSFGNLFLGLRIKKDLTAADKTFGASAGDPTYRPLYPIAELGPSADDKPRKTPHWMQFRIAARTPRITAADYATSLDSSTTPTTNFPGRYMWRRYIRAGKRRLHGCTSGG